MSTILEVAIFLVFLVICYKFSTRNFDYWKHKNVPYQKPLPFVGNFWNILTLRSQIGYFLADLYNHHSSAPYFGLFVSNRPVFVVRSPELIRHILVKDFNYFSDRTLLSDEKCDSLTSKMLFLVKNPLWKAIRNKMTPVFTSGKLKNMVNLLNQSAEEMIQYLDKRILDSSIEAKEVCSKYATDITASCALGINAHSFFSEEAEFREIGKSMFDIKFITAARQLSYFLVPSIVKLFKIPFFDPKATNFIRTVFWQAIQTRKEQNFCRNDVVDIMIQIMKDGSEKDAVKFEGETVVAQAGQFFAAGFETISSTIAFTLYELCLNTTIQNRLRLEIKKVLECTGEISYSAITDMKYLHMVVCETLRRYPVLPFLDRMCLEDYKLPGTDVTIEKGTPVYIPMFGLHHDSKYFPNPDVYDPDRFSDDNRLDISHFSYIPFGEGPRSCIGERFGLMATKVALIHILCNYFVGKCHNTPVPIVFDKRSLFLISTVGLPVKFYKRRMSIVDT